MCISSTAGEEREIEIETERGRERERETMREPEIIIKEKEIRMNLIYKYV